MGYTTEFDGCVLVDPPLNQAEVAYLTKFADTRRMNRTNGAYYVDGEGYAGQDRSPDVLDYNSPPPSQPGLWCKWVPTQDGRAIEWDGCEKFYDSEEWMQYLIDHFLKPEALAQFEEDPQFDGFTFNHVVNGTIEAQGEDPSDIWQLVVEDNQVRSRRAKIVWED